MKEKYRWAKVNYVWTQTKLFNRFLKNFNLNSSFKIENVVGKILTKNKNINPKKIKKCGVFQLTWQDCNRKYIRLNGRHFHIGFQEYFRGFNYGNGKFMLAQHLSENKHFSISMKDIMEVLQITRRGRTSISY